MPGPSESVSGTTMVGSGRHDLTARLSEVIRFHLLVFDDCHYWFLVVVLAYISIARRRAILKSRE